VIRIEMLGDPLLSGPGGPMRGRATYKRRLALLSVLAAARGRPVGRERLMALLWSELPADSARHSLSEALYVLRKELGDGVFVLLAGEVGLSPGHAWTDVDEFERALDEGRAAEAARLYRGPFMYGFHVSDAPEYERWVDGERDRLARLYARAVQGLAEAAEAAGEPVEAAEWWRQLAAHDPYSSRVALRLARALRAAGEGAAALLHVNAHAAFLREELGVAPDAELLEFAAAVRAEAVPAPVPPPPLPRHSAAAPAPEPPGDAAHPAGPAVEVPERVPHAGSPPGHEASAAPVPARSSGITGPPGAAAPPSPPARGRRRARAYPWAALLLAVVLLLALRPPAAAPPRYDPRRVAVMYFEDNSPAGELGYLARGLTEMLIHELGQVDGLEVVSRNGVKPYRDGRLPLDSVAARLRVGSMVEGSVQRAGDRVQVAVHLVDASTLAELESRVIVRDMGDVIALQGALAREVSRSLRRRLGREVRLREAGAETRSADALRLVLRAGQVRDDAADVARSRDPADAAGARVLLARADSLLAAAQAADPHWSRPAVLRGWVAIAAAEMLDQPARPDRLRTAEALANRVLQRDPGRPEALELRGAARWSLALRRTEPGAADRDLKEAERDLRAAVAADSSRAEAWAVLSSLLLARGRFAEAGVAARHALRADAFLADADRMLLGLFFGALRGADYRLAGEVCAQGAGLFPGDWRFVECRLTLLRADASRAPEAALAWRLVADLEQLDPPARAAADGRAYAPIYRRMVAAAVSARAGDTARARLEVQRGRTRAAASGDPQSPVALAYDEAYVLALLGDRAGARARIREYLAARPALRPMVLRVPLLRGLVSGDAAAGTPAGSGPAPGPGAPAR
jgi:DNA-binding SARP family transcriptional activator/TolB-like protein